MSKKPYTRPGLVKFGTLKALTLGNNGCLPDNDNQPANPNISGARGQDCGGGGSSLGGFS